MKLAILSDIHSNLAAITAVLADVDAQGVDKIICLGDIVGYGPQPRECVDLAMQRFDVSILGNHDQGAMFDPEGFSRGAERAIFWTREQLEQTGGDAEAAARRWRYLAEMPRKHLEDRLLFVHGSPRNPLNEYVFPEDVHNARKLEKIFALVNRACFLGHTHVPGIFTEGGRFLYPADIGDVYTLGKDRVMINVGSVGQPRDGDTRSCYVLLEDETLAFRRVEYPVEQTAEMIRAVPELDDFLAQRLTEGR